MSDLAVSPALLQPAAPARIVPERIRQTAQDFEASFLSQMLKPMFEGLSTDGPFSGGDAEGTWRGFLVDAMAKQTAKAGGIGLAAHVVSEMLKMQEQ
jgi:Rod binding domain-containing protein